MLKTKIFTLAALFVVLMSNVYVGRAQTSPHASTGSATLDNNFIVWYHDWFQDYDLGEIIECRFNSDETLLAIKSGKTTSSADTNIYFFSYFNVNKGEFLHGFNIRDRIIGGGGLVFYNDSTILIGFNGLIRYYDINTNQIVKENDFVMKNFPTRTVGNLAITKDKRYLAVSTVQDFFVFDLLTDSLLMKRSIPDMDFFKNPYYNSYLSCRFIEKTNTLLVVKGSQLLEFDYKKDTLLSSSALGPKPSNLDVSDSEDMLTYAAWSEDISNNAYIFNLETKKYQKIQVAGVDTVLSWSNFIFQDKHLQLLIGKIPNAKRLYCLENQKVYDVDLPKLTYGILRIKNTNKAVVYGPARIAFIDGDAFITDVPQDDPKTEILIHPNPGTNLVTIEVNLSAMGFYKLKTSNVGGNIVKSQDYGYLESGKNQLTLNISELIPGIYFLNLTNGTQNYNFKLVKE